MRYWGIITGRQFFKKKTLVVVQKILDREEIKAEIAHLKEVRVLTRIIEEMDNR